MRLSGYRTRSISLVGLFGLSGPDETDQVDQMDDTTKQINSSPSPLALEFDQRERSRATGRP